MKYQPMKLTTAQKLLVAMGLDDLRLVSHHGGKREKCTKRGPGRKHQQGLEHGTAAKPPIGHWLGLHKASAEKRLRRACMKLSGIRQHKRAQYDARDFGELA